MDSRLAGKGEQALEWLSDWLRQIIAVILLAGIIDLLLPSNAYQRYVRLVIGLIILLTLLSPILRLLQGDFETRLAGSLGDWMSVKPTAAEVTRIEEQAASLQQQRAQQAASLAKIRLEEEMRTELERVTGLAIASLTVVLEQDGEARWRVRTVEAVLDEERATPHSSDDVEPVAPVTIEVSAAIELEPIAPVGEDRAQERERLKSVDAQREEADVRESLPSGDSRYQAIAAALSAGYAVAPEAVRVYASTGK